MTSVKDPYHLRKQGVSTDISKSRNCQKPERGGLANRGRVPVRKHTEWCNGKSSFAGDKPTAESQDDRESARWRSGSNTSHSGGSW